MVEVHDGPPMDGFSVPLRLHNLLLALAGPRAPGAALRQRLPFPAGQALPHIGSGAPVVEKPYVGSRAWLNVRN